MPSPPNPGDSVVPLADAARILTGYGVSSGAYTFEDAHRDINAAAVQWPATPTTDPCRCTDDAPPCHSCAHPDFIPECQFCRERAATPTGHTTIRADDLALALAYVPRNPPYAEDKAAVARLRAALPQPGEPC